MCWMIAVLSHWNVPSSQATFRMARNSDAAWNGPPDLFEMGVKSGRGYIQALRKVAWKQVWRNVPLQGRYVTQLSVPLSPVQTVCSSANDTNHIRVIVVEALRNCSSVQMINAAL